MSILNTIAKLLRKTVVLVFLLSLTALSAEDEFGMKRFRSGWIIAAELSRKAPQIKGVSKYEPPSRITTDVAYAAVFVKPDKGRSLGIYDYSLVLGNREYPCIAIREGNGHFSAADWQIVNVSPRNTYTLLFKVQLPPANAPKAYDLRFELMPGKAPDIPLSFKDIGSDPFSDPRNIPDKGIYAEHLRPKKKKAKMPGEIAAETEGKDTAAAESSAPKRGTMSKEERDKYNKMLEEKLKKSSSGSSGKHECIRISASSHKGGQEPEKAFDGDMKTKWESQNSSPQHIEFRITLNGAIHAGKLVIHWAKFESAEHYKVYTSSRKDNWDLHFEEKKGDGGTDTIELNKDVKYLKIECVKGAASYSIPEIEVFK